LLSFELKVSILRVGVREDSQTLKQLCGQIMTDKTMVQEHFLQLVTTSINTPIAALL
jgi:hypothetical protein